MRYRKQEFPTSCGIACVAMLAGKKHNTVLKEAKTTFTEKRFGKTSSYTKCDEIKVLLKKFGVSWKNDFKPVMQNDQSQKKFWNGLEGINLVAVRFRIKDGTKYWHWIVAIRTEKYLKIYDPNPKKRVSCIDLAKGELPNQISYSHAKWDLKISQKSIE